MAIVERDLNRFDYLRSHTEYEGHILAIVLLAQFREPKAYPLVVQFFRAPGEDYYDIFGDMVTEDLPQILASLYDGNDAPLHGLIEDPRACTYCRVAAVDALLHLVAMGVKTREDVLAYLNELFTDRLERVESAVWGFAVENARVLQPAPCLEAIRAAYRDDLIDPFIAPRGEVEAAVHEDPAVMFKQFRPPYLAPITDAAAVMEKWARIAEKPVRRTRQLDDDAESYMSADGEEYAEAPGGNLVRVGYKVLPNDPCPCGSGKKHKKCCGGIA